MCAEEPMLRFRSPAGTTVFLKASEVTQVYTGYVSGDTYIRAGGVTHVVSESLESVISRLNLPHEQGATDGYK